MPCMPAGVGLFSESLGTIFYFCPANRSADFLHDPRISISLISLHGSQTVGTWRADNLKPKLPIVLAGLTLTLSRRALPPRMNRVTLRSCLCNPAGRNSRSCPDIRSSAPFWGDRHIAHYIDDTLFGSRFRRSGLGAHRRLDDERFLAFRDLKQRGIKLNEGVIH